jgi:hypothetical protein
MEATKTEPVDGRTGRPLKDALAALVQAAPPDPAFVEDMEAVLESVGPTQHDSPTPPIT